ncbi:hypothetical protein [uncultured Mesotoga sp.]|uniref:hypothetical protein n=1 Tax=uncultured Mesotoga sp. TaxID=1184400 RepID=UPI002595A5BE|nr:hypothetical protein [uncultured Mesotoga sp.]
MKKIVIVVLVYFTLSVATALAAEPPKQMMNEIIHTYVGNLASYGEFGELVDCVKEMGNKVSWEKVNNGWIMNTKNTDVMTKKTNKGSWMFVHDSSIDNVNRLYFTRLVLNGQEMKRPGSILLTSQFLGCWKKENAAAEKEAKVAKAKAENEQQLMEKEQEQERLAQVQQEKEQELEEIAKAKRKIESDERIRKAENKAREEADLKRKELKQEKESSELKRIAGHYENQQGKGQVIGTLDVTMTEGKTIKFNLYNKLGYAACKIEGEEAQLEYDERGGFKAVYGEAPKGRVKKNDDSCFIEMEFKETSKSVKENRGFNFNVDVKSKGCKQFCERGGTFMGNYWKVADEPK